MILMRGCFFIAFGIAGMFCFITGISSYYDYQQAQDWVTTTGTVTENSVEEQTYRSTDGGRVYYETKYVVKLTYTYTVNGATYESHRIDNGSRSCFLKNCSEQSRIKGTHFSSMDKAEEVASHYKIGDTITVHYLASNPQDTYLEGRSPAYAIVTGIFGVVCLISATWLTVPEKDTNPPIETELIYLKTIDPH